MNVPKEFICVTAQYDNRPALIRVGCIEAVTDNAEVKNGETVSFECRTINYSGRSINVTDTLEDIMNKIWDAEL